MKCENLKCDNEHDGTYGSGRFCSRGCSNSRVKSQETRKRTSDSMKRAIKEGRATAPSFEWMTKEQIDEIIRKKTENFNRKLLKEDFSTLSFGRLRKRVILEQDEKCNRCGRDTWFGEPLVLELEHKDGDTDNNSRENLEGLCPNCHSLTPTWRGRNVGDKGMSKYRSKTTNEERVKAFLETGNIRQALIKLGLAPKGNNYGFIKKALTEWGIDYKNRID